MTDSVSWNHDKSINRHLFAAIAMLFLLICGVGGWASTTQIAGAVMASGVLVVDSNVKKVQHPTGGVVRELLVRDGDRVKADDVLLRLDDTQTRANLAIVAKTLDEYYARRSRDMAELLGSDEIDFPIDLLARSSEKEIANALEGERRLFAARKAARAGQKAQLEQRIVQSKDEIGGLLTQKAARQEQVSWIEKELVGVNDLWHQNLVPYTRVTSLEREAARLRGEIGQLEASVAQTQGKISETELQIIQIDQDLRSEAGKDLADIRSKVLELVERKVAAEDQLKRIDIRAPQDGVVLQLAAHTVGGYIGQGEQIMLIVPDDEPMSVEARISPEQIDQAHVDQEAMLRFTAFNSRSTPELHGTVSRIAADTVQDQKTNTSYYPVRITLPASEIKRLDNKKLVPGMPVEVFIKTQDRNVLSYLVKPLEDQINRAFKER
jgi:HlyD family secretion protein